MTIWVFLTLMFGLSAGFFFTPGRHLLFAGLVLCTGLLSFGLYQQIGSPLLMSGDSEVTHIEDMVATLADRLQREPDDLDGWIMLGRSYMKIGKPADAVGALQKAVDIEHSGNAQTLLSLGEAMFSANKQYLNPKIVTVFEEALLLAPRDPNALYWSGLGAAAQRRYQIAVERWEQLRSMAPPDGIAMIDEGITKWREAGGLDLPPAAANAVATIRISLSLSVEAASQVDADAVMFVIARDPANPSPPIAVVKRSVADIPGPIEIGDADAMVAGRGISKFDTLEIAARVSASGQAFEQPGDWYGSATLVTTETSSLSLVIDRRVSKP